MTLVTVDDVRAAAKRIADDVLRTPLVPAAWAGELWLKLENLQTIGAFKIRGATNAVAQLDPDVRRQGVVTHSSGNHGQAVAWAARAFGVPAVVVMPDVATPVKIDATWALGAEVVLVPIAERDSRAAELQRERGMTMIPPYDHLDVIAGQGTLALEIADDLEGIDTVLVPVGGGGLISGVAATIKALSPTTRVVGVEPELAADVAESLARGERTAWDPDATRRTVADGVRTPLVGEITWPHITALVDEVVTVSETAIVEAVGLLARHSRVVAEPSGALATAAFLAAPAGYGRAVAVVSGGNIDPELLARAVAADLS